ncbi:MAG: hypothetical protein FWD36_03555 [Treponema sp.]|nr:hypothetical protein [Treponema sp.]
MKKSKILVVGFIGLLMAGGLFLVSCKDKENCIGNGECIVSIGQGASGLYVDNNATRSSCGKQSTWSYDTNRWSGGCKVQDNIDARNRAHGTHRCSC